MNYSTVATVAIIALLTIAGCANPPSLKPIGTADIPKDDRAILAGEWEYEDGATVLLRLDKQGNGTYPFKNGRFETSRLEGHAWVGTWSQEENDREGGFSVKLSEDYSEGQGTWWYIRIGADRKPTQKGGTFRLSKKSSLAKRKDGRVPTP